MKIIVKYTVDRNFVDYEAEIATLELGDMSAYPGRDGRDGKYEVNGAEIPREAYEFLERIVKEAYMNNVSAFVDLVDGRAYLNGTGVIR